VPLIASFHPLLKFHLQWKRFWVATFIVGVFFLVWDEIFTQKGVWGFNPKYVTGYYIGSMPIEEILFFICIPYASVFTFHCFRVLIPKFKLSDNLSYYFTILFTLFLLIIVAFNYQRDYTFYTALFTSLFLIMTIYLKVDLSSVYTGYFSVIPFFLLSNGYLTGSFTHEPIVWYNNEENLSIRTFTIPIEDYVYGFLLIAANIVITYWKELKR
jgi:lycopene cyclase domain-containing protein